MLPSFNNYVKHPFNLDKEKKQKKKNKKLKQQREKNKSNNKELEVKKTKEEKENCKKRTGLCSAKTNQRIFGDSKKNKTPS